MKHLTARLPLMLVSLFTLLLAVFGVARAEGEKAHEEGVNATADVRWRMEHDDRDFNSDTGPGSFSQLRTRVNVMWHQGDFSAYVQLQQFGNMGTGPGADLGVGLHRAFVAKQNCLFPDAYLYVGRMTLSYGDERLVGASDWGFGNAFDGVLYGHKGKSYWADVFYTKLAENYMGATTPVRDDAFYGVWGEYTPIKLQAFFLQRKRASTRPGAPTNWQNQDVRSTLGIHYSNTYDMGLGTTVNFAYQMGTNKILGATSSADTELDIAAMMFALSVWYSMKDASMSPTFGLGIDRYSGDDPTSTDKLEGFDNLYWTGHRFFGIMDYFTAPVRPAGLQDIFLKAKVMPRGEDNEWVKLVFHLFSTTEDYASVADPTKKATAVGNELDLVCGKKMNDIANLEAGLGYFMPSEDWAGTDADNSLWAYLQLQFRLGKCDCKK